jgi:hypothetical protein
MSVYTVHAPPLDSNATPDPERFVFVRDGFHFWAFVFAPLWLLVKRQWLAFLGYIIVVIVLQGCLYLLRVPAPGHSAVTFLLHLLVGLEAATIQRWTFNRRGWLQLGLVTGARQETAERRFFDTWLGENTAPRTAPPQPPVRMAPAGSDIVGLFPEPQSRP